MNRTRRCTALLHRSSLFLNSIVAPNSIVGLIVALTLFVSGAVVHAQEPGSVESLIQIDPVLYLSSDGMEPHRAAYEQTAAYKAFYESGLVEAIFKLVDQFGEQGLLAREVGEHLTNHGGTLAVNLPGPGGLPIPRITIIAPQGAKYADRLKEMAVQLLNEPGAPLVDREEVEIAGRSVFRLQFPNPPQVEVSLWTEGDHLVLAAGIGAAEATINVAEGKVANITTGRCWKEYIAPYTGEGPTISRCWLDFEQIRKNYGEFPIPTPDQQGFVTPNQVLEIIGLHELRAAVMFSSIEKDEIVKSIFIEVPSPAKGVMTFWDPAPLDLEQEMVLPANLMIFGANSVDWTRIYDAGWDMAEGMMTLFHPQEIEQFEQIKQAVPQIVGFDPREDLVGCLGSGTYVSVGADSGVLSIPGMWIRQRVTDEEKLKQTLALLFERIEPLLLESDGTVTLRHSEIEGKQVTSISLMGAVTPSVVIDDGWLMIGSTAQVLKSYWLQEEGKLATYKMDERTAGRMKNLPEGTISYGISDPTYSYRQVLALAPMYIGMGQQMLIKEGILDPAVALPDLPPAELITQHIRPNFTIVWRDKDKLYANVYTSVPEVTTGLAITGVLAGILAPAVMSAREAALRARYRDELMDDLPDPESDPEEEATEDLLEEAPRPQPKNRRPLPLPAPEK